MAHCRSLAHARDDNQERVVNGEERFSGEGAQRCWAKGGLSCGKAAPRFYFCTVARLNPVRCAPRDFILCCMCARWLSDRATLGVTCLRGACTNPPKLGNSTKAGSVLVF